MSGDCLFVLGQQCFQMTDACPDVSRFDRRRLQLCDLVPGALSLGVERFNHDVATGDVAREFGAQ